MNEKEQLDAIEQFGVLIAEREASFCHVRLYQIDNFYVELYHHTHFNVTVKINSFTNTDFLDSYLQNIDIDSILYASGLWLAGDYP